MPIAESTDWLGCDLCDGVESDWESRAPRSASATGALSELASPREPRATLSEDAHSACWNPARRAAYAMREDEIRI